MARSTPTNLNVVTKRIVRAGRSEVVTYYYHRPTGTPLGKSTDGMTREQAEDVIRLFEAETKTSGPVPGTVNDVFARYRASAHFASKSVKTQYEYRLEMGRIEGDIGHRMVASLEKSDITRIRDERVSTPFAANSTIRTFSAILSWGVRELDFVERNPCRDIALLPTQPRDAVWLLEHRAAFMETAGPHLRRALATLRFTVQRTSDMLLLRTSMLYEHRGRMWINLRQSKTGALVAIPLHADLMRVYAENPVDGDYLCPSPDGTLWTYGSFADEWDKNVARANIRLARRLLKANPLPSRRRTQAREAAKMEVRKCLIIGLQRRDLRRTGMVELALSGVPDHQIASLSGHSIETTRRILDTYIPRRSELALAAVEQWEASGGTGKVIALHTLPVQRSLEAAIERVVNAAANRSANLSRGANRKKAVSP